REANGPVRPKKRFFPSVLVVPPQDWWADDRQLVDGVMKKMGLLHSIDCGDGGIASGVKRVVVLNPITERGSALVALAQKNGVPVTISGIGSLARRLSEDIHNSQIPF
ncbi:MAG: hypothetical protein Q8P19_03570, partial [bacterium]|nr:hypothetical protein [bacterium]